MSKWLALEDEINGYKWIVILPETDIKPHSKELTGDKRELADNDCPCNPRIDWINNLIIHNSFEDIEKIEFALNKLK